MLSFIISHKEILTYFQLFINMKYIFHLNAEVLKG